MFVYFLDHLDVVRRCLRFLNTNKNHAEKLAYSLLKARPSTIRRISLVPAPISYSFALHKLVII